MSFSIPFFFQFIGPHQHKHFPVFFIRISGKQDQHGIFLFDACKPVQVCVLLEGIEGISIAGDLIIAVENGNAVFLHLGNKTFSVIDEDLWVDGFGVHGINYIDSK